MMAAMGVTPLHGKGRGKGGAARKAPPPRRAPTPRPAPLAVDPAPAPAAPPEPDWREVRQQRLDDLQRQVNELRTERDRLAEQLTTAEEGLAAVNDENRQIKAELSGLQVVADRVDWEERLGSKPRESKPSRPSTPSLAQALSDRGLDGVDEAADAIVGLLTQHGERLLRGLEATSDLALLLDERVVLAATGVEIADDQAVVVRVPAHRCEITGGSDVRAAFRDFLDAAREAQVQRITLVGGSPAYRRELKLMLEQSGGELRLDLVQGTTRRPKRKAESDQRGSDVVVLWGSTLLDHSVTVAYSKSRGPLINVPHRGITRMLREVVRYLRKE